MTASLARNVGWAIAGNFGYAACQCAVLALVARMTTAADVGRLALALALTAPATILTNLQLRVVLATDARHEQPVGAYLGLRLVSATTALAVIAALAVALGYRGATLGVILAVGLAKAFEGLSDILYGVLQRAERLRTIAVSMLVRGLLSVTAIGAVLALTGNLVAGVTAMALGWGLTLVAYDRRQAARTAELRPVFEPATLTALARVALPLGCMSALQSLATNLPRYAIEVHLGTAALGHFAALAYIVVAATQPVLGLGAAAAPRLAYHFATDRGAYWALASRAVAVAGALGVMVLVAAAAGGRAALTLAYGAEYAAHAGALSWLAVAAAMSFVSAALGCAVTAARRFPQQLAVGALACAVCGGASTLLVPRFGITGAAWAVVAAEATRLVCLTAVFAATAVHATARVRGPAPEPVAT